MTMGRSTAALEVSCSLLLGNAVALAAHWTAMVSAVALRWMHVVSAVAAGKGLTALVRLFLNCTMLWHCVR